MSEFREKVDSNLQLKALGHLYQTWVMGGTSDDVCPLFDRKGTLGTSANFIQLWKEVKASIGCK